MTLPLYLLHLIPLAASAETLIGHADKVRDGDTIVVSGVPIRVQGVTGPEPKEKGIGARNRPCSVWWRASV